MKAVSYTNLDAIRFTTGLRMMFDISDNYTACMTMSKKQAAQYLRRKYYHMLWVEIMCFVATKADKRKS